MPRGPRRCRHIAAWGREFLDTRVTSWSRLTGAHALGATRASGDGRNILNDFLNDGFRHGFRHRLRCWRNRFDLDDDFGFRFRGRFNARSQALPGTQNGVNVEAAQVLEASLIAGKRSDVIDGHWCSVPGEAGQFCCGQDLFVNVEQVNSATFATMVEHVSKGGSGHFRAKHDGQEVEINAHHEEGLIAEGHVRQVQCPFVNPEVVDAFGHVFSAPGQHEAAPARLGPHLGHAHQGFLRIGVHQANASRREIDAVNVEPGAGAIDGVAHLFGRTHRRRHGGQPWSA